MKKTLGALFIFQVGGGRRPLTRSDARHSPPAADRRPFDVCPETARAPGDPGCLAPSPLRYYFNRPGSVTVKQKNVAERGTRWDAGGRGTGTHAGQP